MRDTPIIHDDSHDDDFYLFEDAPQTDIRPLCDIQAKIETLKESLKGSEGKAFDFIYFEILRLEAVREMYKRFEFNEGQIKNSLIAQYEKLAYKIKVNELRGGVLKDEKRYLKMFHYLLSPRLIEGVRVVVPVVENYQMSII
jgi:hypothetical protein